MGDICTDNRFEMIEKYRELLKENTNIETSYEEMQVIDNILFRFWQMGWLDKIEFANNIVKCKYCEHRNSHWCEWANDDDFCSYGNRREEWKEN